MKAQRIRIQYIKNRDEDVMQEKMSPTAANPGRRHFLKLGVWSGLALATVSGTALLSGCSSPVASKFLLLRDGDVTLFKALLPVILAGALPDGEGRAKALDDTLHSLDELLYYSSVAGHKQLGQLFDLLTFAPTRLLTTGLGHGWDKASAADVDAVLQRLKNSRVAMLRSVYNGLLQMSEMSWYLQPQSWVASGYEHPVKIVEGV
jgi:hypothetical protein